jgi:aminoglycoside phosphotransferase
LKHQPLPIPAAVLGKIEGWETSLAYSHRPQTATWRLRRDGQTQYLKVERSGETPGLGYERDRMVWARGRLSVPEVIEYGTGDGVEWLLTWALPGLDATSEELSKDPASLVRLLAEGLREFHETPVRDCPFSFRIDDAMPIAIARVEAGVINPGRDFDDDHAHLTPSQALAELEALRPTSEDIVLCHGDYCPPNVIVSDGQVSGSVDLGGFGLADRWWDLAIATWSVTWNLGPGWEDTFLRAYGVQRDTDRIRYFRLLYDLVA